MSCILWIEEQRKKKKMEQESKKKEIENINSVQKAMNKLSLSWACHNLNFLAKLVYLFVKHYQFIK